ncbi:MAG: hypothetical protein EOP85_02825, partial [Verrucomicrobiaceae bacterium]
MPKTTLNGKAKHLFTRKNTPSSDSANGESHKKVTGFRLLDIPDNPLCLSSFTACGCAGCDCGKRVVKNNRNRRVSLSRLSWMTSGPFAGTGAATPTNDTQTNQMNIKEYHPTYIRPYPDLSSVPSELSLEDTWDGEAVSELIRSKCANGETPAFLFLGRKEASLLKEHLAGIFGEESVTTLQGTYYMGLDVVPVDCEKFLST